MKIERTEKKSYIPLKIQFENQDEENHFISIIDKVDAHRSSNVNFKLIPEEYSLIIKLSDWFTKEVGFRDIN